MRAWILMIVLVACEKQREVTVQLGPTPDTLSVGFACRQDADPTKVLGTRAVVGATVQFTMIVDLIDFGATVPGCRGEELLAACPAGVCTIVPRDNGKRFCKTVSFDAALVSNGNLPAMLDAIRDDLDDEPIITNAPARPVMIRALATAEPIDCNAIPARFDDQLLVGCAYSCPVSLDSVDAAIALSLDALSDRCEREVKVCAHFPF
ncbi:MAG: hypothetical protein ABI867_19660 [Kofleriaceae bacterium]